MDKAITPPNEQPVVENNEPAVELARKEELPPLEEQVFEQLLDFSDATRAVEAFMDENPEATREEVTTVLESFEFPERQHEYFLKGIETLFTRREQVATAIDTYKERFGEEEYEAAIFKELFGTSGTFGKVELIPDKNNLMFMCEHHFDFAQSVEKGSDAYAEFEESGMSLEELPSSDEAGIPLGVFLADPDLELDGVGSMKETVILINKSGALEREEKGEEGSSLDGIIKHEQQHAENSLYSRPGRQFEKPQEAISESVDSLEEMIQRLEIETLEVQQELTKAREDKVLLPNEVQEIFTEHLKPEQRERLKELFEQSLDTVATNLEKIIAHLQKTSIETTVKEELLAYYLSGTANEDIDDIIPIYVTKLKAALGNIRLTFEKMLLKYYPDDLLEELGMENPKHRRLTISFSQLRIAVKGTPSGPKDEDVIGQHLAGVEQSLDEFEGRCSQSTADGLEIFRRVDEEAGKHSDELRQLLKPMLISQPMEKWEGLFEKALQKVVPKAEAAEA
jgi:hypothetical protein